MYKGRIQEHQSGSKGILNGKDADSIRDRGGKGQIWKEEIHSGASFWRHETESEYERVVAQRETEGQEGVFDHVHCTQSEEDSEILKGYTS